MRAVFYATVACWIRVRVCACYLNAPYVPLRPFMINERFKLNITALHHPHQCNYGFFLHLIGFTSTYRFVLLIVCVCARSSDRWVDLLATVFLPVCVSSISQLSNLARQVAVMAIYTWLSPRAGEAERFFLPAALISVTGPQHLDAWNMSRKLNELELQLLVKPSCSMLTRPHQ